MSNYSDSLFDESNKNTSWYKVFNIIEPESKVLDVGCSSGNFGEELIKRKGCVVDGIELDKKDYILAKSKLRNVWQINIESDNLQDLNDRYDYIYFGDVIEHLVSPTKALSRIKHLFKPGGQIVFSIPNMAHSSVRLMLLRGEFSYGETGLLDKTHLHFYDYNEVKRVFSESGYEITQIDAVVNEATKELLEHQLDYVGLKLTKKFLEFTINTDASVYQFVGVAKPVTRTPKHKPLQIISPANMNQAILDNTVRHFEHTISAKNEEIKNLEKRCGLILEENLMLRKRYRHLDRAYRLAGKTKKIISKHTKQNN